MLIEILEECKTFLRSSVNNEDKRATIQTADFAVGLMQATADCGRNFSLAELRLSACSFLGACISISAFNARLQSSSLNESLYLLLTMVIGKIARLKNLNVDHEAILDTLGVKSIHGIDSSMVSLWDGLSEVFGGTFMTSSIKLHFSINLLSGAVDWFKVTEGKVHDSQWFPRIQKGKLYVYDLGYWSIELLQKCQKKRAFYLSRLKSSAKIIVEESVYGLGMNFVGKDLLKQSIRRKRTNIVELIGTLVVGNQTHRTRVVGFWHKGEKQYRWYVTNLTCGRKYIYQLYRLRWQVELCFKAMKTSLSFDRIPTLNKVAAQNFVLIAVLNYLFTVLIKLNAEAMETGVKTKNASIQKAAKLLSIISEVFFSTLTILQPKNSLDTLQTALSNFRGYFFDPNHRNRKSTVASLASLKKGKA